MEREGHKPVSVRHCDDAKPDYYHMVQRKHWGGAPDSSEFCYLTYSKLRRSVKKGRGKDEQTEVGWGCRERMRGFTMKLVSW